MPRKLDPVIADTLKRFGFGPDACWDCHGVWVVYHRVLEQIAAKADVRFDPPVIVEADSANGVAAVCVTGNTPRDDGAVRYEWSIGEAAPKNNKNAYPWAMAEKRAKDRVILKLIGLHGLAYSEEEADDFKAGDRAPPPSAAKSTDSGGTLTSEYQEIVKQMAACVSLSGLANLWTIHAGTLKKFQDKDPELYEMAVAEKDRLKVALQQKEAA